MPSRSDLCRASGIVVSLLIAACGGGDSDPVREGNTGPVAAKAVADVDAAMADARQAPAATAGR